MYMYCILHIFLPCLKGSHCARQVRLGEQQRHLSGAARGRAEALDLRRGLGRPERGSPCAAGGGGEFAAEFAKLERTVRHCNCSKLLYAPLCFRFQCHDMLSRWIAVLSGVVIVQIVACPSKQDVKWNTYPRPQGRPQHRRPRTRAGRPRLSIVDCRFDSLRKKSSARLIWHSADRRATFKR